MKDCDFRQSIRRCAMPFAMLSVLFCSFQCTDLAEFMSLDGEGPEVALMLQKEDPVWPVYSVSENLPSTNIYFVVWDISDDGAVWAECPEGDLEVSVTPVCTRYTLSVSATKEFSGESYVKIIAKDGDHITELPVRIELARIVPTEDEISVRGNDGTYPVSVDTNMKYFAEARADWVEATVEDGKLTLNVSENNTGSVREAAVFLHDIYEVVTAEILVVQKPLSD